jgi:hypothetical protein
MAGEPRSAAGGEDAGMIKPGPPQRFSDQPKFQFVETANASGAQAEARAATERSRSTGSRRGGVMTEHKPLPDAICQRSDEGFFILAANKLARSALNKVVYDGQALVGLIEVASDGTVVVFDARGKTRGSYPTYDLARDALNRSPARKVGARDVSPLG